MIREELYKKITNIFENGCLSEDVHKCEFDGVCELHEKVKVLEVVEEYSKQIRADAIEEFQEWLKTQIVGIDNKTKEILVVREDRWELAIDEYKKQLKENK